MAESGRRTTNASAPDDVEDVGTRAPSESGRKRPASSSGTRAPSESGRRRPTTRAGSSGARKHAGTSSVSRPRRWLRRIVNGLKMAAEIGLVLGATGALVMWCSIPETARLADGNPASTAFIDLRREQAADAGRTFALEWQWRPINRISRYLRAAVIYAEDYKFYQHDGVDWDAVEDALETNLDKGSLAIGGSTITQQLAKNLYLSPSRSMVRKAREMLIAFSLEDHLSKQRILELYLNVVEWGDGVFGAEAAARHWFKHSAQTLTPAEAVRLAIALPNPIQRAPNVRTPELTKKAVRLIRLLRFQGLIDELQEREALDQVGAPGEKVMPSRRRPVDTEPEPPPPATDPIPASPPVTDPPPTDPAPTDPRPADPPPADPPPE